MRQNGWPCSLRHPGGRGSARKESIVATMRALSGPWIRLRSRWAAGTKSTLYTEFGLDLRPGNPLCALHRFFDCFEVVVLFKQLDELFVEIDRQHDGHLVTSLVADESRFGQRHGHDSNWLTPWLSCDRKRNVRMRG